MPIKLQILILLISTILNSIVVLLVVTRSRWHLPEKFFSLSVVGVVLWALSHFLFDSGNGAFLWLAYVVTPLIAGAFFIFVNLLPDVEFKEKKKLITWVSGLTIAVMAMVVLSGFIVEQMLFDSQRHLVKIQFGFLYWPIFGAFIILFFAAAFVVLLRKIRRAEGFLRIQFWYIFWGAGISAVVGVTTNLILPYFGHLSLFWVGPSATMVFSTFTVYAIFRHHLLNIRVIGTEVFAGLVVIMFFVQMILSQGIEEALTRLVLFIFVLLFSIFLVRGTLREVETLRRLSEAKTEFISIASHQLRTPLAAIKGFISMLLEGSFGEVNESVKDVLNKVFQSNERLIKLIEDLLDISRIEEGRFSFDFAPVALGELLESLAEELIGMAQAKNLKLNFVKPPQDFLIYGDAGKLRQVFLNLMDNAIRYTPSGEISVSIAQKDDGVLVLVKDTGVGIAKDDLPWLFDRFSRGKRTPSMHTEGVGLGLYIAKKIIEAHKGKIWAESEGPEKGTTFFVELPLKN